VLGISRPSSPRILKRAGAGHGLARRLSRARFVDAHVHFPQLRIIGALGRSLLDWLEHVALPEEVRMREIAYAQDTARRFVHALASHGTTTAMVFGAHFSSATAAFVRSGRRGRGARDLRARALRSAASSRAAPDAGGGVTEKVPSSFSGYHRRARLLYAVTPRFAFSTSEAMLEVCQTLLREHHDVRLQTHINENTSEIAHLARLFPWAGDYLSVYEKYSLSGRRSVMAHNVHPTDSELDRLAGTDTSIAHCPASNAMLGSGCFPLRRHMTAGVRCALGTDVGGGVGFGMLKEGLHAYLMQRLSPDPVVLDAGQLLHLATLAGAEAGGPGFGHRGFHGRKGRRISCSSGRRRAACSNQWSSVPTARRKYSRRCSRWLVPRACAKSEWPVMWCTASDNIHGS
jgi:guanine deaminase